MKTISAEKEETKPPLLFWIIKWICIATLLFCWVNKFSLIVIGPTNFILSIIYLTNYKKTDGWIGLMVVVLIVSIPMTFFAWFIVAPVILG
ncbi:MAG: hypothetical protein RR444_12115 [Oscillospiraceae bacterium]